MLIDALFKNSKRPLLGALASPTLIRALRDPSIGDDPELHNFLQKSTPAWVSNCAAQNSLNPQLAEWQNSVSQTRFIPKLTPELKAKFSADIEAGLEVLTLFSDFLLASLDHSKGSDKLLAEILPNVREITRRTGELESTLADPKLRAAVAAEHQLGLACQQAMSDLKKSNTFDIGRWISAHESAQRLILGQIAAVNEDVGDQKRARVKKRKGDIEDLSQEEFFAKFDQIKGGKAGDLLDFEVRPPPASDSLIDSLIDI
jgi:hypothetical protein